MARTVSMGNLVLRCKQRCDLENATNPSDTEWKAYINTLYAELHGIVTEAGLRHKETEATITTTGVASYALPSDFLTLIGVDYQDTAGNRRELLEFMTQERNATSGVTMGVEGLFYSLVDVNVVLYPTPPAGQTYKLLYVPQPVDISGSADGTLIDTFTVEGEKFIVWGVTTLALFKLERDLTYAELKQQEFAEKVLWWATNRSLLQPRRRMVTVSPYLTGDGDPADW